MDNRGLADPRPSGRDQHFGLQREPDRRDLAFGQCKTDALLDPRQGLVRINPWPRQRAVCQPPKPFGKARSA
jgi:hypothetical protein